MNNVWNKSFNFLLLPVLLISSLQSQAQLLDTSKAAEVEDNGLNLTLLTNEKSELRQSIEKAFGKVDAFCQSLDLKQVEIEAQAAEAGNSTEKVNTTEVAAAKTPQKQSRLEKEISRYRVRFSLNASTDVIKASYRFVVQPTFVAGEQQRLDIYELGLGVDNTIRAGAAVRITFARIFKGPKAKMDAITSCPIWPTSVPTSAQEAREKMKIGETTRLEVSGLLGAELSEDLGRGNGTGSASLGYKKEALFLADFYKHSENHIRTRFLGLKNHGQLNFGVNYNFIGKLLSGTFLPSKIRDQVSVGVGFNLTQSYNPFKDYPIDSLMVDYLFNLNNPEAKEALDQIFDNIKQGNFLSLFSLTSKNDDDLADVLIKRAAKAEKVSGEDRSKKVEDRRVYQIFKGRLQTSLTSIDAPVRLTGMASLSGSMGWLKTFVSRVNEQSLVDYSILNSSNLTGRTKFVFGRWETLDEDRLDLLMGSDEKATVKDFKDLVIRIEAYDKSFSSRNLRNEMKKIRHLLPHELKNHPSLASFLPDENQTNGRLRYQLNFGIKAFKAIQQLHTATIAQSLLEYFDADLERKKSMNLPCEQTSAGDGDGNMGCGTFAYEKATEIKCALTDASMQKRYGCFQTLSRDGLFRKHILPEFLPSLLPADEVTNMIQFMGDFASNETGLRSVVIGQGNTTEIYRAVNFLRQILNERSLDLRLEEIREGGRILDIVPRSMSLKPKS